MPRISCAHMKDYADKFVLKIFIWEWLLHFSILLITDIFTLVVIDDFFHLLIIVLFAIFFICCLLSSLFNPLLGPLIPSRLCNNFFVLLEYLILHIRAHIEDIRELNSIVQLLVHERF